MNSYLFTSESVTEGHPDKVCDQISDAILDEAIRQDPNSRVACETCAYTDTINVFGEMTTHADVDIEKIVRKTLKDIGYYSNKSGFNGKTCNIISNIHDQSPDIALGTNDEVGGAGDQGIMFGYACNESPDYLPLPIYLAHRFSYALAEKIKNKDILGLLPDGKTQVTIEYNSSNKPIRVDTILISTQHEKMSEDDLSNLKEEVYAKVISPVLYEMPSIHKFVDTQTGKYFFNPTGLFTLGGPNADSGLTGRKIIVDTYGGYAPHGGGAFSGKDPTKVDRSATYMARYIAKNIVANGIAEKCLIQLSYAIGIAEPVSVYVNTYGTSSTSDYDLTKWVKNNFDLTPQGIIKFLDLRTPIYQATSNYGHFGTIKKDYLPSWEKISEISIDSIRSL